MFWKKSNSYHKAAKITVQSPACYLPDTALPVKQHLLFLSYLELYRSNEPDIWTNGKLTQVEIIYLLIISPNSLHNISENWHQVACSSCLEAGQKQVALPTWILDVPLPIKGDLGHDFEGIKFSPSYSSFLHFLCNISLCISKHLARAKGETLMNV